MLRGAPGARLDVVICHHCAEGQTREGHLLLPSAGTQLRQVVLHMLTMFMGSSSQCISRLTLYISHGNCDWDCEGLEFRQALVRQDAMCVFSLPRSLFRRRFKVSAAVLMVFLLCMLS